MWVDVTPIVDEWHGNPEGYRSYSVDVYALTAGNHDLKVEYFESTGNAGVQVRWEFIDGTGGGGVWNTRANCYADPACNSLRGGDQPITSTCAAVRAWVTRLLAV